MRILWRPDLCEAAVSHSAAGIARLCSSRTDALDTVVCADRMGHSRKADLGHCLQAPKCRQCRPSDRRRCAVWKEHTDAVVQQVGGIHIAKRIRGQSLRIGESGGERRAAIASEGASAPDGDCRVDAADGNDDRSCRPDDAGKTEPAGTGSWRPRVTGGAGSRPAEPSTAYPVYTVLTAVGGRPEHKKRTARRSGPFCLALGLLPRLEPQP
jgi:hypothetical protein